MICKYVFPFSRLSFQFLDVLLMHRSFWVWRSPVYLFLLLVSCKNPLPNLRSWLFISMFFSKGFMVLALLFIWVISFWVNFCLWWELGVQLYSFLCVNTVVSHICWRNFSSPIEWTSHLYQNAVGHRHTGLFVDLRFYFISVYARDSTTLFDYCSFVVSLRPRGVSPLALFFCRIVWLIKASCSCIRIWTLAFPILQERQLGF